jgi:hypothetical protein
VHLWIAFEGGISATRGLLPHGFRALASRAKKSGADSLLARFRAA